MPMFPRTGVCGRAAKSKPAVGKRFLKKLRTLWMCFFTNMLFALLAK